MQQVNIANIPVFYERADGGQSSPLGTPTPSENVLINYVGNVGNGQVSVFEELSNSPHIEFGEQCTITHQWYVDYMTGILLQQQYQRGAYIEDNGMLGINQNNTPGQPPDLQTGINVCRVLSTDLVPLDRTNTNVCLFTMVSEGTSFGVPPEEFQIETVELNPVAEKHPRYSALSYYQRNIIRNTDVSDYQDVQQTWQNQISSIPSNDVQMQNQQGQAYELLFKKQKGEDSFYMSGYKLTYSQYFWAPQTINPGGFIQDPTSVVPAYYLTTPNGNSIFYQSVNPNPNLFITVNGLNPQYQTSLTQFPYGLSWLRQTDTQVLNRTWWKLTYTWLGAYLGHWDNEWYNPSGLQPLQISASLSTTLVNDTN